jgi:hypothetical protein
LTRSSQGCILVSPLTKTVNILFCCEIDLLIYYVSNTIYLKPWLLLQSPFNKNNTIYIRLMGKVPLVQFFNDLRCSHLKQEATTQWKIRLRVLISARQVSVNGCHGTIDQLGWLLRFSTSKTALKDLMGTGKILLTKATTFA